MAGAETAALEAAEGWVATLPGDGSHEQVEFRIEWPGDGAMVALSHVPASLEAAYWPVWLSEKGEAALTGEREDIEVFEVERWVVLEQAK